MRLSRLSRRPAILPALLLAILAGGASRLAGVCGVFTDTANDTFCPFCWRSLSRGHDRNDVDL